MLVLEQSIPNQKFNNTFSGDQLKRKYFTLFRDYKHQIFWVKHHTGLENFQNNSVAIFLRFAIFFIYFF
jgi:hypothetical protein